METMDLMVNPKLRQIVDMVGKLEYLKNNGVITSGEFKIAVARYRPSVLEILNLEH